MLENLYTLDLVVSVRAASVEAMERYGNSLRPVSERRAIRQASGERTVYLRQAPPLSIEGLDLTEVAPLHLLLLILKDGHRSLHAHEAELSVKRLFARDRIQDDFLVTT